MELGSEYSNQVLIRIGKNQKALQFKHHQITRWLIKTTFRVRHKVRAQRNPMEVPVLQQESKTTFEFATIETAFSLMKIPILLTYFKSP